MQTESRTSSLFECYAEVQPIFCKDIHYLRNKYDLSHNKSKFDNSTLPPATIQHSTFKIQHCACATIQHSAFKTQHCACATIQHSKFNIPLRIPLHHPPHKMARFPYWRYYSLFPENTKSTFFIRNAIFIELKSILFFCICVKTVTCIHYLRLLATT